MARFISRCNGIDLLDGPPRRCLDELVIPAFGPADREAYDDERVMSAIVQA